MFYVVYVAAMMLVATSSTFSNTIERERGARRATMLQAWQLRQLVPKP
jgi:hypothetical protein